MFQKVIIFIFLCIHSFLLPGQDDWVMRNQVIASLGDQTVKAYIKPEKQQPRFIRKEVVYHYYRNGELYHTQGGFAGYLLDGEVDVFDREQRLVEQGQYIGGIKTGLWKEWYPNGMLKRISRWRYGLRNGKQENYNEAGEKTSIAYFRKGKLHKKQYSIDDGRIFKWTKFRKGKHIKTKILTPEEKNSEKEKKKRLFKKKKNKADKKSKPREKSKPAKKKESKSSKKKKKDKKKNKDKKKED